MDNDQHNYGADRCISHEPAYLVQMCFHMRMALEIWNPASNLFDSLVWTMSIWAIS